MSVSLAPLAEADLPALREVRVAPDQVIFSGQPEEVLEDHAPLMDVHVIHYGARVAGMFRIDRGYHEHWTFADPDTPGLRTWLIDEGLQGRGIASEAAMLLKSYLRQHYPTARGVFLTVNIINPKAKHIYLRGGFNDTGKQWLRGEAGPQNVLFLPLQP